VRAITGEEVIISNKNLLDKELHNMARLNRRRIMQPFGLVYRTSPDMCARMPEIVREVVDGVEKCSFLRCGMTGYGASSLDFAFEFDVKSEVWQKVFDARSQVLIALLQRFKAEGIEFAYPTQTSYTAAPDGTLIMPYPPPEGEEDAKDR
jgi:small-conductance mechanosensitive channel